MSFYVYILASRRNGTLYVGMTDDLIRRIWMHRNGIIEGEDVGVVRTARYPRSSDCTRAPDQEMESSLET
jgi:putative endonuclease